MVCTWIKHDSFFFISVLFLGMLVLIKGCFIPEFQSPLQGLQFKRSKGYPRKNISDEINLNNDLRETIRSMGRMRVHERKIVSIFPEEATRENENIPFTLNACSINRKYYVLDDMLVDKNFGDCWILRQWRGINITWAECNRYCQGIPAKPPIYVYLCIPGHVIQFSFWAFCPLYRRFIMRTLDLPQYCYCTKYSCLIQPRIIDIGKR